MYLQKSKNTHVRSFTTIENSYVEMKDLESMIFILWKWRIQTFLDFTTDPLDPF